MFEKQYRRRIRGALHEPLRRREESDDRVKIVVGFVGDNASALRLFEPGGREVTALPQPPKQFFNGGSGLILGGCCAQALPECRRLACGTGIDHGECSWNGEHLDQQLISTAMGLAALAIGALGLAALAIGGKFLLVQRRAKSSECDGVESAEGAAQQLDRRLRIERCAPQRHVEGEDEGLDRVLVAQRRGGGRDLGGHLEYGQALREGRHERACAHDDGHPPPRNPADDVPLPQPTGDHGKLLGRAGGHHRLHRVNYGNYGSCA